MERREYNGWTNYETWLVNMWYGDVFADMQENGEVIDAEYIKCFVEDSLESEGNTPQYGFAADIMNAAMRQVDWEDLASHYEVEEESEDA